MLLFLQVVLRGLTQSVLFMVGDAFQSTTVAVILAEADFDEHEYLAFSHDDIDLTMPAMVISGYRF